MEKIKRNIAEAISAESAEIWGEALAIPADSIPESIEYPPDKITLKTKTKETKLDSQFLSYFDDCFTFSIVNSSPLSIQFRTLC